MVELEGEVETKVVGEVEGEREVEGEDEVEGEGEGEGDVKGEGEVEALPKEMKGLTMIADELYYLPCLRDGRGEDVGVPREGFVDRPNLYRLRVATHVLQEVVYSVSGADVAEHMLIGVKD